MRINKSWLAAILVFIATQLVKKYNISLAEGWEDTAYSVALDVVQYGSAAMAIWWNKHINHQTVTLADVQQEIAAAKQETPKSYQEMAPYMQEVHDAINDMLAEVKSGRYTDAKKEAIETYLKMYELIKQKGA